jgi:hypothetical protein
MKNRLITCCLLFIAGMLLLVGFTHRFNTLVTGSVNPMDAGLRAWVFSATDTLTSSIENNGRFQISNVKAGQYRLLIEGKPPYRNVVREGIVVTDGAPVDVGTIEMQK